MEVVKTCNSLGESLHIQWIELCTASIGLLLAINHPRVSALKAALAKL
jgi:hypothetical protein